MATERVFRPLDYAVFSVLSLVNLAAVTGASARLYRLADPLRRPLTMMVLVPLVPALLFIEARWFAMPLMRRPVPLPARPGWRVAVVTTFVPGVEAPAMLERTLRCMVGLDYPHDTWVLDEGDDPWVRELCQRLGAHHFTRHHRPEYLQPDGRFAARTKHGNYNAWLYEIGLARYELVAGFDPDHVPRRQFLVRLLGYFDDRRIGYVQAAQVYYNQPASFVARGAAEETYAYYASMQMTSYTFGYPIVTGCHNVQRVAALRQAGGFSPHDADDLLITAHHRAAGWEGVYVAEELAAGLTPVDWTAYLLQQRRWARSVIDVKLRFEPKLTRRLPLFARAVSLSHGLSYLQGVWSAATLTSLVLMLALRSGDPITEASSAFSFGALGWVLAVCDLYRQRFYVHPRREFGLHLRGIFLKYAKWPYMLVAFVEAVAGRRGGYVTTAKAGRSTRASGLLLTHSAIVLAVGAAWVIGMATGGLNGVALHLAAGLTTGLSTLVVISGLRRFPPSYDDELAARMLPYSSAPGD